MTAKFNYYDNVNNNRTIFELEKEIAHDIDSFNREYLKYAKCTTITGIKNGESPYFDSNPNNAKANIYNDLSVNTLTCSTMPITKNAACKISGISNARQILPTNKGTSNYSRLTSLGSNTSNRVDWTIYSVNNGTEVSGNYIFEVSGNDVYVYRADSNQPSINITYKIIEDYDCTNANSDTGIATLASNIGAKVTSINNILNTIQTNGATDKVNDQQFDTNLATNIKTKHQEILNLRNDLDMKMREMRNMGDGGYRVDQKIKMDATLYSSLAWTILATSLLYYVFVKMD